MQRTAGRLGSSLCMKFHSQRAAFYHTRWLRVFLVTGLVFGTLGCERVPPKTPADEVSELRKKIEAQSKRLAELEAKQSPATPNSPSATPTNSGTPIALEYAKIGTGAIGGAAFLTTNNKEAIILRDTEVFLCTVDARAIWLELGQPLVTEDGPLRQFDRKTRVNWDWKARTAVSEIHTKLLSSGYVIHTTRTDVEGKYSFKDLAPGWYQVYAKDVNARYVACWFTSVKATNNTVARADLTNSTADLLSDSRN